MLEFARILVIIRGLTNIVGGLALLAPAAFVVPPIMPMIMGVCLVLIAIVALFLTWWMGD